MNVKWRSRKFAVGFLIFCVVDWLLGIWLIANVVVPLWTALAERLVR